jgi:23S rRNA (guanine745-N1)-methyltransferase
MRADVLRYLCCPVCGRGLASVAATLRCDLGHSFDPARQGYVQLTAAPLRHSGDTAAMVAARAGFLAAGHYAFIADALAEAAANRTAGNEGLIVDVGAGTGYHLARVLDAAPDALGLALDSSKAAARQAARAHPRASAVVCDAWARLPVADGAARVLLNVFAPRNRAEFRRILAPDGVLLVVTPEPDHLVELVRAGRLLRVDPSKEERLQGTLGAPEATFRLSRRLRLDPAARQTLAAMGPSAWHAKQAQAAGAGGEMEVTAAVRLSVYRLR